MTLLLLLVFWLLWFLNFSSRAMLSPLLPIFERDLNINHALAGSVFFFLSVGYTLSLLMSGWLTFRIGFKRSIILGVSVMAGAIFCLSFATSYLQLSSFALMIGLGAGVYLPSAIPILTHTIKPEKWGKAIAFHDTAASFSILAIPLLTALVLRFLQWTALMFALGGGCLAAVVVFSILSPDIRHKIEPASGFLNVLKRRDFWAMGILWSFAGGSNLGLYNIIPLFLVTEKGMDLETANTVFGFSRSGALLLSFLAGFLADRYGTKRVLLFSLLATGACTVGVALAHSFRILVTILFMQGTFCTMFFPVGLVAISKVTEFNERSLFTGITVAFGVIFGAGITPFLLGAVADVWSFHMGILFQGLLTIFSSFFLREFRGV
jgi:NNP family nitrate/nitrite transporter-like MFS transporter